MVLHHYPVSPFSEKIRLILGYKKLAWKSVIIPSIMPKPDLVALTGGYRRTPVLQVGADIYCDTALICDELEHRQPAPSLHPQGSNGAVRIVAQWADSTLFWAAMAYCFSPKGAAYFFQGQPPEVAKAFAEDRAKMRGGAGRMPAGDATSAYKSYQRRIASMVDNQPYVMGEQPSLADFSCYHALWFTQRIRRWRDSEMRRPASPPGWVGWRPSGTAAWRSTMLRPRSPRPPGQSRVMFIRAYSRMITGLRSGVA